MMRKTGNTEFCASRINRLLDSRTRITGWLAGSSDRFIRQRLSNSICLESSARGESSNSWVAGFRVAAHDDFRLLKIAIRPGDVCRLTFAKAAISQQKTHQI